MSVYFQKARELGNMILQSPAAKNMADASANYDRDKNSVAEFENYKMRFEAFQGRMQNGQISEAEYNMEAKALDDIALRLKKYPVIAGIIDAENEFNGFVTEIMEVLQATVMNGIAGGCGGGRCSGKCGGACKR